MTRCTLYILLPISIVAALFFVWQGSIQNFKGPDTVQTVEGATANHRAGPAGIATGDQDVGNQWRRILQREFVPSLRESDPAVEPAADAADLRAWRRTDVHVRQDGAGHAPRLGDIRNDVGAVSRRRVHLLLGRAERKSDDGQTGCRAAPIPALNPAATWKAKKFASATR